jgi:hypothetical protein
VTAIAPYLKVLDRLDRYQTVAGANQAYDEEARKKLMDKINRIAANLGVDEVIATAVQEHLKRIGENSRWRARRDRCGRKAGEPGRDRSGPRAGEPGRGGTKRGGQLDVRLRVAAQPDGRV